ncbi:MAG TPA: zinc ribbon domain-containing protein [Acidimicrobiales bacterium]|nr:zinc ribbon domain-containing protein [Acidimicrobiales bacterium]
MPTYEYRCKSCSHELEAQQSFTDDPLTTCPSCGAETLRKVFGNIAVTFKGSGFYKTDSRPAAGKSSSSSESGTSDSGAGDAKKSDAKSGTTSETKTDSGASKPATSSGTPTAAAAS